MFAVVFLTVFFIAWIVLMWLLHHALTVEEASCLAKVTATAAEQDVSVRRQPHDFAA